MFKGGTQLIVIPKKGNKRDKYTIRLEGFNPDHNGAMIESALRSKFHQNSLIFTLNYADPPYNTRSSGNGIIYTSNNKLAQDLRAFDNQRLLGRIITVTVQENIDADSSMKRQADRIPDKYAILLYGLNTDFSKQMIEDEFMIQFDLDTIKFRLNFSDFPKNKISAGSGVIYCADDSFAEQLRKLNGTNFMGHELTVEVKEQ